LIISKKKLGSLFENLFQVTLLVSFLAIEGLIQSFFIGKKNFPAFHLHLFATMMHAF